MRDSDSSQAGFKSPLLNDMIHAFPALRSSITELIGHICMKRAAEGRKDELWLDKEKYPRIEETRMVSGDCAFFEKDEIVQDMTTDPGFIRDCMQWR